MKKYLLSILGAALFLAQPLAAQLPAGLSADRIVFDIKPGAKGVKLTVRMPSDVPSTRLWHGEGADGFTDIQNSALADDKGVEVTYQFAQVSDKPRQIAVETDKVVSITSSPYERAYVIAGVAELASKSVTSLLMTNNQMDAGSKLDLSKAVALEEVFATSTGVEEVILPKGNTLKRVNISSVFLGKTFLKSINLSDAVGLEELRISEHAMDTIDLRKNVRLTVLNVANSKHPSKLRAILGVKALTQLKEFNGEGNRLGFDQLPDMLGSKDDFRYGNQSTIKIADERIKGVTVDLSHLYEHKGINGSAGNNYRQTTFEWESVVLGQNDKGQTVVKSKEPIDPSLYKQEGGVFTFDESLLVDGKRDIRVRLSNPAYPGIGTITDKVKKTFSDNILTYVFAITTPKAEEPNPQSVVALEAHQQVAYTSGGSLYFMPVVYGEVARVYSLTGELTAKVVAGAAPLQLAKGIYIVQVRGNTAKVFID